MFYVMKLSVAGVVSPSSQCTTSLGASRLPQLQRDSSTGDKMDLSFNVV